MSVATLANTKCTVQSYTESKDAAGGVVRSWSDGATVWARVQALNAQELQLYDRTVHQRMLKAYISGTPEITAKDKLTATINGTSRTFLVVGVRDIDMLGRFTTLHLEEEL